MKTPFGQRFKLLVSAGRRDREGIISFILLLIAITSIAGYFTQQRKLDRLADQEVLFSYLEAQELQEEQLGFQSREVDILEIRQRFDPNQLDVAGWMRTGLSERQALSVLKYLSRGSGVKSISDLSRIHVLSDRWHRENDSLLLFPSISEEPKTPQTADVGGFASKYVPLELNSADTNALVKINGIGAYSARAIVKYRERLGGFVSYDQLNEIRALREEVKEVLRTKTILDQRLIRTICIDTCSAEDLIGFPYLKPKQVRTLLNFRDMHGGFSELNQLKECVIISDSLFLQIEPYLLICNE